MLKQYISTTVLLFFFSIVLSAQNNINFFNFLDYSSKWKHGAYFANSGGTGRWKEIYHIKGDTSIANQWYYKVYNQYQLFDNDYKVKKITNTYAYALREDKDSLFHFVYPNGNTFTINHSTTHLTSAYPYNQAYLASEIPFVTYFENEQYGSACGLMQGIGNTSCPPNTNGVLYFECYTKKGLSSDVVGKKCSIELLSINSTTEGKTGDIRLFPNPFDEELHIEFPSQLPTESTTIALYDSKGSLHKKEIIITDTTLDMSNIQSGLYILSINTPEQQFFYKIIK